LAITDTFKQSILGRRSMDESSTNTGHEGNSQPRSSRREEAPETRVRQLVPKKPSFTSVNQVLSRLVTKLGLDKRLKEHALLDLWSTVAGTTMAQRSRPLYLDTESNLVIAVKDAPTGQELSLMKLDLLQKLRPFARAIGINVTGMRFDLKHFHAARPDAKVQESRRQEIPQSTEADLAQINLTPEAGASANICERIATVYERELRLKHWRQSKGFPLCVGCGEPAESFHGREEQCHDCYFELMSHKRDI
jgi:Dna[CI] antecedent, DciA